jgi:putative DNA primase/helicase
MGTKQKTIDASRGQWRTILTTLGISSDCLNGRHGPCPICGGKDRFRFDDKNGKGTFYCNGCGAGDGLDLIQKIKGVSFSEAARMVDDLVRTEKLEPKTVQAPPQVSKQEMAELWKKGIALTQQNIAGAYIYKRCGITQFPEALRWAGGTMIARVTDPDGNGVQIHKTKFDHNGEKTDRRMMRAPMPPGSAIRLYEPIQGVLGVAEGIETAISAAQLFKCPTWALINANNLEKWLPPNGVEHVMIFGDNDFTFTGQAAAYNLAKRIVAAGKCQVSVIIPPNPGWDWNDVHQRGEIP